MGACNSNSNVNRSQSLERTPQERKYPSCKLFVGTWNVGNAPPPDDLSPWIRPDCDIYVIGTQECQYKERAPATNCQEDWLAVLAKQFGDQYVQVAASYLLEMRIAIFATKTMAKLITNIQSNTEATGIGSVYGNKGGVAISMKVDDTSVCFINSHLAAHQDKSQRRNDDVKEIVKGLKLGADYVDVLHQFHHVIWMGDLNYRLDFGDQGKAHSPSQEQFDQMVQMIHEKKYDELLPCDQLHAEMKAGKVFLDFQEGDITFAPTFKVERNEVVKYKSQRSPAWCDRILWKSFPTATLKQIEYTGVRAVLTSDHKPVLSLFEMEYMHFPMAEDPKQGSLTIRLENLKGEKMKAADIGNSSDPYLIFDSADMKQSVKTKVIKKTLNPEWKEPYELKMRVNNPDRLLHSFISVQAWDKDLSSQDDRLGNAVIHLADFIRKPSEGEFKVSIRYGGLAKGFLSGKLSLVWN